MPNFQLGMNAHAYYSATAVTASDQTTLNTALGTATEITNIKDLKINLATDKADVSTRGNNGWKQTAATLKDGTVTFSMVWKPADTNFTAILTAWQNSAEIAFFALDELKATTGAQGAAGNFTVTNFSRTENLADAIMVDVELSPSSFNNWVVKT